MIGGYKFPGAPAADLNTSDAKPVSAPSPTARLLIDDSLDIPNFLRRASFDAPQRSNADAIDRDLLRKIVRAEIGDTQ